MQRVPMGFAGRAGWIVDTLDDHVQTIQAATADLRRLRLRLLESVDGLKPCQRVRELPEPFRHVSRRICARVLGQTVILSTGGSVAL